MQYRVYYAFINCCRHMLFALSQTAACYKQTAVAVAAAADVAIVAVAGAVGVNAG